MANSEYMKRRFSPSRPFMKEKPLGRTPAMMMASAECCISVTIDGRTERVLIASW